MNNNALSSTYVFWGFFVCFALFFVYWAFLQKEMAVALTDFPPSTIPSYIAYGKLKTEWCVVPSEVIFVKWPTLSRSDSQSLLKTQCSSGSSIFSAFSSCFPNLLSLSNDSKLLGGLLCPLDLNFLYWH